MNRQESDKPRVNTELAGPAQVGAPAPLRLNSFELLTLESRRALASISLSRTWKDGDTLLRVGEVVESVFMVTSGHVRVATTNPEGMEVVRRWIRPNELVGLCPAISGEVFTLSIVACGEVKAQHISSSALVQLMRSNAGVAFDIAKLLARKVQELAETEINFAREPLRAKVYSTLERLSRIDSRQNHFGEEEVCISQYEIACMVGSSRQHVNSTLKELQADGLLKVGYKRITLPRSKAR
ncbi:Crp/Fnr family transcriptional regulator [Comamonadaceae bacterium G21597-S1]|nr:Crp/Fnr family transcriptional regulator [Comamonadaceae bacterium G21597-S1]